MAKKTPKLLQSPRPPTAFDVTPTDNDLVIGDPHGDLDGVKGALKAANWNPDKQRIFSVGDNIDRGHQSKETLDFMKQYGVSSILGNHDWAHHRYGQHMINAAATGKKIPQNLTHEMADTKNQLGDDYIRHTTEMGNYPLYLPFEDSQGKGHIVHGGVNPYHEMNEQEPDKMLIRRFHPSPNGFQPEESEEHPYWQRSYQGHLGTILHGHNPMSHHHNDHGNPQVYSLDGGGAFGSIVPWGGKHRVMRLGDRKVFESPGSPASEANFRRILADKKREQNQG